MSPFGFVQHIESRQVVDFISEHPRFLVVEQGRVIAESSSREEAFRIAALPQLIAVCRSGEELQKLAQSIRYQGQLVGRNFDSERLQKIGSEMQTALATAHGANP